MRFTNNIFDGLESLYTVKLFCSKPTRTIIPRSKRKLTNLIDLSRGKKKKISMPHFRPKFLSTIFSLFVSLFFLRKPKGSLHISPPVGLCARGYLIVGAYLFDLWFRARLSRIPRARPRLKQSPARSLADETWTLFVRVSACKYYTWIFASARDYIMRQSKRPFHMVMRPAALLLQFNQRRGMTRARAKRFAFVYFAFIKSWEVKMDFGVCGGYVWVLSGDDNVVFWYGNNSGILSIKI